MSHKSLVLLVDDDASTHELLQDILDHAGMELKVAWNHRTALSVLAESQPDVILLDIFLPDIDGYKLLEEIRALPGFAECPIIATTGYYTTDSTAGLIQKGFNALLLKPYDPEQVITILNKMIPH